MWPVVTLTVAGCTLSAMLVRNAMAMLSCSADLKLRRLEMRQDFFQLLTSQANSYKDTLLRLEPHDHGIRDGWDGGCC